MRHQKAKKEQKRGSIYSSPSITTSIATIIAISSQFAAEGKVKAKIRIEAVPNIEIQQRL